MSAKTSIEWTDATWNPIRGCSRVSEGCRNCYAERVASRFSGPGMPYEGLAKDGHWTGRLRLVEERLEDPLRWKKSRLIFVNSMSDLFHENLSDEQIAAVFGVMGAAHWHTFQVLTKRPERMLDWMSAYTPNAHQGMECLRQALHALGRGKPFLNAHTAWPFPNVWLGISVEDQKTADERMPLLLQTPAAVRFVSAEPLLGPVDLVKAMHGGRFSGSPVGRLDWVIVGGESGPSARPMHPAWARILRDQCQSAGIPFFFKQWGEWQDGYDARARQLCMYNDGRSCEWTKEAILAEEKCSGIQHQGHSAAIVSRVGKRAAGRRLDGQEWSEFPDPGLIVNFPLPHLPNSQLEYRKRRRTDQ